MLLEDFAKNIFKLMIAIDLHNHDGEKLNPTEYYKIINNPASGKPISRLFYNVPLEKITMMDFNIIPSYSLLPLPYLRDFKEDFKDKLDLLAISYIKQGAANVINRNANFDELIKTAFANREKEPAKILYNLDNSNQIEKTISINKPIDSLDEAPSTSTNLDDLDDEDAAFFKVK